MKKFIAVILALVSVLSLAACGETKAPEDPTVTPAKPTGNFVFTEENYPKI